MKTQKPTDEYMAFCRGDLADPYPLFRRLRAEDPIHWCEIQKCWVLTCYDDVLFVLRDSRLSSDRVPILMDRLPAPVRQKLHRLENHFSRWLLFQDAPGHTRLRGLVNMAFTPKVVRAMRPRIEQVVNQLIDAVESAGRMDLVADFAYPLPSTIISDMIGVPGDGREQFIEWSGNIIFFLGGTSYTMSEEADRADRSFRELTAFFRELLTQRRQTPQHDLISSLLAVEEQDDTLSEEEVIANCILLLTAGHETTMTLISNGILALLQHPGELDKLRSDPSLITSAIEEMLRYESPAQRQTRLATEDIKMGGRRIRKGDTVLAMQGAANRDPAQFPDPDRFDVGRKDNRHVAFGAGAHFCLGAPLARIEAEVAIHALLRRLPGLRLASGEIQWRKNMGFRSLKSLPVVFQ